MSTDNSSEAAQPATDASAADAAVEDTKESTSSATQGTSSEETEQKSPPTDDVSVETKPQVEDTKMDTEPQTTETTATSETKDSNSENDEEIDAALKSEREKLKQKLEAHKSQISMILHVCHGIDFALAALLMMPPNSEDYVNWRTTLLHVFLNPFYLLMRLADHKFDSLDSAVIIILRVLCLWKLTNMAIKWGHTDTHVKIQSSKQSRQDWENSGLFKFGQGVLSLIDVLVHQTARNLDKSDDATKRHNMAARRASRRASVVLADGKVVSNFMEARDDDVIYTHSTARIVSKLHDYDAQDTADFWKSTIWTLLFLSISVFQSFIGFKIVFFQKSSLYYVCIYTVNILLCHFELYYTKKYIDDCTEPDNKYLVKSLHTHPLFKRKVPGHFCDLCWKRIDSFAFRCAKCDFDLCKSCWRNKEKARLAAQNQIRNEKSKNDDDLAKLDKAVTLREYLERMLSFHRPYFKAFIFGLMVLWAKSIITLNQSSRKGYLFDNIVNKDINAFYSGISWYVVFTVMVGLLQSLHGLILGRIRESINNDVQKELFHRTMSQDMVFYDGSTTNVLIDRCSWGLNQMMRPFQSSISTVISSTTNIIGGMIMCWSISYRLTLLGLSTLGPIAYLSVLFREWYWTNLRQQGKLSREVRALTNESFSNIKTIRAYGKEPSIIRHYKELRNELHNFSVRGSVVDSLVQTVMGWFNLAGSTLITWAGGIIVFLSLVQNEANSSENGANAQNADNIDSNSFLNDTLTLGQLMAFELYWGRFAGDFERLRRLFGTFENARFKAKQIFRTLDAKPSIELLDSADTKNFKDVTEIEGDIYFNDVRFTYQLEPNKEILKGLSLKIPKGKTTAFVGKSGGGKTTLISLLLRLYDPSSGSITINDTQTGEIIDNIKNYNVYSWRHIVALVSQETELFGSHTMAHNIGFGLEYYKKQQLYYASNLANSHEFIESFDDKYDARIGDRGCKLSGGQKQRISIARMLMKRPSLMLLDEATSALDAESEAIVQAALEQAMQDSECTVILVAHRLSTVVGADQICVVHNGTVAEKGTHDELLEMNGIYAKLVDRQVNLKQTMKDKVKQMTESGKDAKADAALNKSATTADTIDALLDEINKKSEETKEESINSNKSMNETGDDATKKET